MYGRTRALSVSAIIGLMALLSCTFTVSASPVSDVPDALNDAIFGGTNLFGAQAVLTAIVMVSVGMLLAMLDLNYLGIFIVLFAVLGGLTAMGWADPTLIFVAGLIAGGMFVEKIASFFTGRKK